MLPWEAQCKSFFSAKKDEDLNYEDLNQLQRHMDSLKVSHLRLYRADEVQNLWSEKRKSTGIKAEYIDGVLIVTRVLPRSVASKQGLLRGDHILSINGENPDPTSAEKESGEFIFRRKGQSLKVRLEPTELIEDQSPQVVFSDVQKFILKIPSFRGEYFTDQKMDLLVTELKEHKNKKLILDLRKNGGGNFVAGLRFLSFFLCQENKVGFLLKHRESLKSNSLLGVILKNELNDEVQYDQIKNNSKIELKVPVPKFCLNPKQIKVLVDFETASTAEMVALALKEHRQAVVLGSLSAGQLLVGSWYPFQQFGKGVQISIPEAIYESDRGTVVEGQGLRPDQVLYYDLKDFENGNDSWELKAVSN